MLTCVRVTANMCPQNVKSVYQYQGQVGRKDAEESDDLDAHLTWHYYGFPDITPEGMHE